MAASSAPDTLPTKVLRDILASQYHAALAMLREAIELCPDLLWTDDSYANACWQLAYHTLYYTHLYLQPDEAAFQPWQGQQPEVQHPDAIPGREFPDSPLPLLPQPYTRDQVLEYWRVCDGMVDDALAALDLGAPTSGFSWYRISKLEHQLVSLRHIQHHAAQLADRLRARAAVGVRWVGNRTEA